MTQKTMNDQSAPHGIAHSSTRNLFRYWEAIRGERCAPLRSDISLKQIRHLLPWVFIAEPDPNSTAHRLRLAGTGVCQIWGENVTGKDPFGPWPRFERETMHRLLQCVVHDRQPFVMRCRARTDAGNTAHLEIIGLPVEADTGARQVFGLIVPFNGPEWLGRSRMVSCELTGVRIIWTEPVPPNPEVRPGAEGPRPRHPNLQLIRGGLDS